MVANKQIAPIASLSRFPLLASLACIGTGSVVANMMSNGWVSGFSSSLWVILAASFLIFLVGAVIDQRIRGLSLLVALYALPLAVFATIWSRIAPVDSLASIPDTWTLVHVATAVMTFALLTLAACAGVAVLLRERALKRKSAIGLTSRLIRDLPSVRDAENLQFQLLAITAALLAVGIASGMSVSIVHDGPVFVADHKSVLTLIVFAAIVLMLVAHWRFGLRGRQAVRILLGVHLVLTLAYPGVKFVTDFLLV